MRLRVPWEIQDQWDLVTASTTLKLIHPERQLTEPNMVNPSVSVVIPVYNPGRHLVAAIGSILEQTREDWECICVNDGSTDGSGEMLDRFAAEDSRIKVVHQANAGFVRALNVGCGLAKSNLICRMDADDISMPDRLERQLASMQAHPNVVALGGAILEIDAESQPIGLGRLSQTHTEILNDLLHRRTGLFHPTALIRADALKQIGGYRSKYPAIEDHDLWLRLSKVGELANTADVVLCYRQHSASMCWQNSQKQRELMTELLKAEHAERGLPFSESLNVNGVRTKANPGKWARMAARGGYPRTAFKHLRLMWHEQGLSTYTIRMTAEVCLRATLSVTRRSKRRPVNVPDLTKWQTWLGSTSSWEAARAHSS